MELDFWAKTSGTWINTATVLTGTTLGLLLRKQLPKGTQTIMTQGIGLLTVWLGLTMASSMGQVQLRGIDGAVLGLLVLVLGGVSGEWLQIEERLTNLGEWLKVRFRGHGAFTEGFVASSLLFCVGPMTVLGSFDNGLRGDSTLLTLKATMDGLVSIALANVYGVGVGFSILVILLYQGSLSLLVSLMINQAVQVDQSPHLLLITGVGGLMIMAIGGNLLAVTKIRVASFLPALALAPLICWGLD